MRRRWHVLCFCLIAAFLAAPALPATDAAEALAFRHLRTLREAQPPEAEFRGDGVAVHGVAFSPDGKTLAAASSEKTVTLYELPAGRVRLVLKDSAHPCFSVTFSPVGNLLAYGGMGARIHLLSEDSADSFRPEASWVEALAFSPDGTALAVGNYRDDLQLYDVKSRRRLARLDQFAGMGQIDTGLYKPSARSLAFSPNGKLLAAGIDLFDDELPRLERTQVWNVPSGELKGVFVGLHSRFVPDGRTLVSLNAGKIELRSVETLELQATFEGPAPVTLFDLSHVGTVAAAVAGEQVQLGTLASRKLSAVLKGHGSPITSIAFSNDGKLLAAGSRNGAIQLWKSDAD